MVNSHPLDELLLRRIEQHHSRDFRRIHAGKDSIVNARKRLPNQHVWRRKLGIGQRGVQIGGDFLPGKNLIGVMARPIRS